ncbi:MAG: DUF6507 family protein, partial [Pseudonocardiaceae bacterium]
MSRWDISPSGVRGVLSRTETVAQEFEGQMTRLRTALEGAVGQSSSEIVASAVGGFMERSATPAIQFVFTRTGACLSGAAQATNHYLAGDLEMAANAQAAASAAPDPRA